MAAAAVGTIGADGLRAAATDEYQGAGAGCAGGAPRINAFHPPAAVTAACPAGERPPCSHVATPAFTPVGAGADRAPLLLPLPKTAAVGDTLLAAVSSRPATRASSNGIVTGASATFFTTFVTFENQPTGLELPLVGAIATP